MDTYNPKVGGFPGLFPAIFISFEFVALYWGTDNYNLADLGGPQVYHFSSYLFAAGTKHTKHPRTGLRIGLQG